VRVSHVALAAAETLGLKGAARRTVFCASILHDSGVAVADLPPEIDPNGGHVAAGGWVAAGRPQGVVGGEIPFEALIVNAVHWAIEIAENPENPLRARASLSLVHPLDITLMVGSEVAEATTDALHGDGRLARRQHVERALGQRLGVATGRCGHWRWSSVCKER
jgi:hypothetical protein